MKTYLPKNFSFLYRSPEIDLKSESTTVLHKVEIRTWRMSLHISLRDIKNSTDMGEIINISSNCRDVNLSHSEIESKEFP